MVVHVEPRQLSPILRGEVDLDLVRRARRTASIPHYLDGTSPGGGRAGPKPRSRFSKIKTASKSERTSMSDACAAVICPGGVVS